MGRGRRGKREGRGRGREGEEGGKGKHAKEQCVIDWLLIHLLKEFRFIHRAFPLPPLLISFGPN